MNAEATQAAINKHRETLWQGTPPQYRQYALNPELIMSVALSGEPPYWKQYMGLKAQHALEEVLAECRGEKDGDRRRALPGNAGWATGTVEDAGNGRPGSKDNRNNPRQQANADRTKRKQGKGNKARRNNGNSGQR